MSNSPRRPRLTRRMLLRSVSSATGALAAASLLGACQVANVAGWEPPRAWGAPRPVRVGVLLPRSRFYPAMSANWLAGLQAGLESTGPFARRPPELILAEIAPGRTPTVAHGHRLLDGGADLLAGLVPPDAAADLGPALGERGSLLIASSVGANSIPRRQHVPQVLHTTLAYWQASWALGGWSATNHGPRAVALASHYESGYDALAAFRHGFEQAGGDLLAARITHLPHEERVDYSGLFAEVAALRPDFVYAAYSGPRATEFLRAYHASELAGRVPLVGSPYLTSEHLLAEQGRAALGVTTALGWADGLPSATEHPFVAAYQSRVGRPPDSFALLGYETAQLLGVALLGESLGLGSAPQALLAAGRVHSPRGSLTIDGSTQSLAAPVFLREVQGRRGAPVNLAVAQLAAPAEGGAEALSLRGQLKTGWINAYLCV